MGHNDSLVSSRGNSLAREALGRRLLRVFVGVISQRDGHRGDDSAKQVGPHNDDDDDELGARAELHDAHTRGNSTHSCLQTVQVVIGLAAFFGTCK